MSVKIRAVTARAVLAPLPRPITTAVAAIPKAPLVLIDVFTENGPTGRAYVFAYTPMALAPLVAMIESIAPLLIGRSAAPKDRMRDLKDAFHLLGRQGLVGLAMSGLDMALWDIAARAMDQSVAALLGADPAPVPCYDSHGVFRIGQDEPLVETSLAQGFQALKFKIGGATLTQDVAALRVIRDLIGPDIRLMADYNQSLSAPEAIRRITRFEEEGLDLAWIEEPVAAEDFAGHCAIRRSVSTPIQTGEGWWMPADAARAIGAGICDHAMPDLGKIGGITGWQQAAAMADVAALPVSSHLYAEASAHVLAATPNRYLLEYLDVAGLLLVDPPQIENGALTPRGPGLGLEWNEAAVRAAQV